MCSSYGEAVFLAIQTIIIAFLVLFFSGQKAGALGYIGAYVAAMGFLLSPYAPFQLLSLLQTSNAFVVMVSKVSGFPSFLFFFIFFLSNASVWGFIQKNVHPSFTIYNALSRSLTSLLMEFHLEQSPPRHQPLCYFLFLQKPTQDISLLRIF